MRRLSTFLAVTALLALVVPASAGAWVDKTTRWTDAAYGGLVANGRLVGDGTTLLYLQGTSLKKYVAATDSWTDVTGCPVSISWGTNAQSAYIGGDKIVVNLMLRDVPPPDQHLYIYDISDDTWTASAAIPYENGYWGGQGMTYNPVTDKVMLSWSDKSDGAEHFVSALYDVATGTWGARYDYRYSKMQDGAWAGTTYYSDIAAGAATGSIRTYDCSAQAADFTGTWVNTSNYDLANDTSAQENLGGDGTVWGTNMLAVYDGKIYATGADNSNAFIVYDPATDTWSYPQDYFDSGIGGYRTHSVQFADDWLYMQQSGDFWAWQVPEPATMALLGFGGLGLLIRRKK